MIVITIKERFPMFHLLVIDTSVLFVKLATYLQAKLGWLEPAMTPSVNVSGVNTGVWPIWHVFLMRLPLVPSIDILTLRTHSILDLLIKVMARARIKNTLA